MLIPAAVAQARPAPVSCLKRQTWLAIPRGFDNLGGFCDTEPLAARLGGALFCSGSEGSGMGHLEMDKKRFGRR
jgi:hypothetical protein